MWGLANGTLQQLTGMGVNREQLFGVDLMGQASQAIRVQVIVWQLASAGLVVWTKARRASVHSPVKYWVSDLVVSDRHSFRH